MAIRVLSLIPEYFVYEAMSNKQRMQYWLTVHKKQHLFNLSKIRIFKQSNKLEYLKHELLPD